MINFDLGCFVWKIILNNSKKFKYLYTETFEIMNFLAMRHWAPSSRVIAKAKVMHTFCKLPSDLYHLK